MIFATGLFVTILLILIVADYFYKKRSNNILSRYKISGPKTLPLLGNALDYCSTNNEDIFWLARRNRKKYGRIFRLWIFHKLSLVISDAKYMETILSNTKFFDKSDSYNFLRKWLGTGLLLSNRHKWQTRRKILTPTFHSELLQNYVEVFNQQSTVLVQKLQAYADGKTIINIYPIVCLTALDIITETAMGVKVNAQQNPELEYVKALSFVSKVMADCLIKPLQSKDWLFGLTAPRTYWNMMKCIKIMHNFTQNVIEQRKAELKKSLAEGSPQVTEVGTTKRMALLDVLLQSTIDGSALSNEDIREEVDTFVFEGHDTTTSGISFCLHLIAHHPAVQLKLLKEIRFVIGDNKHGPITYQQLHELKYLECVIKESLRLFPPVPAIERVTTEEIVLHEKTIIPAHTNLMLMFFICSRDAAYFDNPDFFKPERFEVLQAANKGTRFANTPFSAGTRNCIGRKFAMMEMKCTICKILSNFELLPLGEKVRPAYNLVLRSANGVQLGLKKRDH